MVAPSKWGKPTLAERIEDDKQVLTRHLLKLAKKENGNHYDKEWAITHAFQSIDSRDWDRTPLCVRTSSNLTINRSRNAFNKYSKDGSELGAAQLPSNYLDKDVREGELGGATEAARLFEKLSAPSDELLRHTRKLVDLMEDFAILLEIDPCFFGDSHKSEQLQPNSHYKDLQYDLSATEMDKKVAMIQEWMFELLPHMPRSATDSAKQFLLFLTQQFVNYMGKARKFSYTKKVAMLFLGVPYLNHLGRTKFCKTVTASLVAFRREIYRDIDNVQDFYPNQWPNLTSKYEVFSETINDLVPDRREEKSVEEVSRELEPYRNVIDPAIVELSGTWFSDGHIDICNTYDRNAKRMRVKWST